LAAVAAGGHLRVGMEDTLSYARAVPPAGTPSLWSAPSQLARLLSVRRWLPPTHARSSACRRKHSGHPRSAESGPLRRGARAGLAGPWPYACRAFANASVIGDTDGMPQVSVNSIGDYIRRAAGAGEDLTPPASPRRRGVLQPFISARSSAGLRKPSAEHFLQQIRQGPADLPPEALYVQAGGSWEDRPADSGVRSALLTDPNLVRAPEAGADRDLRVVP